MGNRKWIVMGGVVLIGLYAAGCAKSSGSAGGSSGSGTTVDVKQVVTTGESLSYNDLTGGVNDLAVNPVTHYPAVAYYDKNANLTGSTAVGALKYAYMTSDGAWTVEVVDANYGTAACGTANGYCIGAPNAATGSVGNIIKLGFNSAGNPAIAYVFGNSVNGAGTKQLRYAERSSAGKWGVSVAYAISTAAAATNVNVTATVDPMKGVTLNFDSSDRPHMTVGVYTQTITNSNLQYIFRDTGGSWNASQIATIVSGVGTITAVNTGMNQAGAVMCPNNGMLLGTYFNVDTAAGIGNPMFFRCTALAANGGCSTWSTLDTLVGCTGAASCYSASLLTTSNAGTRTDITIDPATGKPVVGIYSTATPNTSLYTLALPNACDVAQPTGAGSWGAPVLVGNASQGLNGFRLAASSSNYFLAYLTSTTNAMLSIFSAGAWFATGHLIETQTVAGEGMGLKYDSTNDMLYASYSALPGAAAGAYGNDVKVSYAKPTDLSSAGAAGTLPIDVVDNLVTVFPSTAIPMLSAAKAPNGTVGYTYFFQDGTVANSKLYYGVRSGTPTAPVFAQRMVTNYLNGAASPQFMGSYPSLAYDANSNPIVAFYNGVTGYKQLIVARSRDNGTSFSLTIVDNISGDVGMYPSVAVSGDSIGVAYYDNINTGLKFARYTPGTGWRRFAVDGMAGTGSCGNAPEDDGKYATLKFTSSGTPVIVYQSNAANLKVAVASDALTSSTYTWTCGIADASAAQRGEGIDLALDSNDYPHIVHFDATAGNIRYTTCNSTATNCIATGPSAFTSTLVGANGVTTTVVTRPTIAISSAGTKYVSYYSASFQALALASMASGATTWTTEFIDQATSGASFVSAVGQYGVMLLNSSENPMAFYRSTENWLKYFSREEVSN